MSAKHTPGPWRIRSKGNMSNLIEAHCGSTRYEGDDGFQAVATFQACCTERRYADQEANALANGLLIAAAPDLLRAVEVARATLRIADRSRVWTEERDKCVEMLEAAIAKAEGQTNGKA